MRVLLVYTLFFGTALAFQLPFKVPFFTTKQVITEDLEGTPRIAIIGAGAGGSSAAFWIAKAKERFGVDVEIDVYERSSYIGGRSTVVYPYNDTDYAPVELGASIFVEANKNLMRASKEFNLTLTKFEDDNSDTAIWDGEKFIITMESGAWYKSWWATLKLLWRYGYASPNKTRSLVQDMIKQFVGLYTTESPRWDNVATLSEKYEWSQLTNSTTFEYLQSLGVSSQFATELVEAATRVNYGQDVDEIHALEGLCSMAASGASGVEAGNFKIFEHFLKHSGATVHLNTEVKEIARKHPDSPLWAVHSTAGSQVYRGIILAAPFHQSGISIPDELAETIPAQPYVHLHVTLLSTTSPHPNPQYFGLPADAAVPTTILTTYDGVRAGGFEPEFNSLSYHGPIHKTAVPGEASERVEEVTQADDAEHGAEEEQVPEVEATESAEVQPEWAVKIFSKDHMSDEWLKTVFGQVGWVYRKEWDAYPKLPPAASFPPVKLDQGFYYVNSFEPFISTMETETISSRNVVDLLLHEEFESGICGSLLGSSEDEVPASNATSEGFVLGWDC